MLSPWKVKALTVLPKKVRVKIVKQVTNWYIDKYVELKINGSEKLKNINGPVIFVCNHLSNADALVLDKALKVKDPFFVAGVKLTKDPVTNLGMEVVKTINIKPNTPDKDAITHMVKCIKEKNSLLIFPEGTRSRTGSMIEGKKGVLLLIHLTNATVIPVSLCGTEKVLPISKTGHMGDEKWQKGKVTINVGDPVIFPEKNSEEKKHEYNDRCMTYLMKNIAKMLPESYRGVYK